MVGRKRKGSSIKRDVLRSGRSKNGTSNAAPSDDPESPFILQITHTATLALFLATVSASPFDLTEQYVEEFAKGIDDLRKIAADYKFEEASFDPEQYNETDALKGWWLKKGSSDD